MKGEFKVSLHKSGNFKAGFTEEYERKHLKPHGAWQQSRHLEEWHVVRPVSQPVLACRFLFPESELRHVTERQSVESSVSWLPAPPIEHTVCVQIVLAPAHSDFNSESPRSNILKTWALANSETIWIGIITEATPQSVKDDITEFRKMESRKLDGRSSWKSHPEARLLVFGPNEGGWTSIIDAAFSPE